MPGVGLSPKLGTCETSQVLLAGGPGVFYQVSSIFVPPIEWPVSYELNYLEREIKLNSHVLSHQHFD